MNSNLNDNSNLKKSFTDLNKDELLTKMNNLENRFTNKTALTLLNVSNNITKDEKMSYAEQIIKKVLK